MLRTVDRRLYFYRSYKLSGAKAGIVCQRLQPSNFWRQTVASCMHDHLSAAKTDFTEQGSCPIG